jgi:hypothetical protein
MALDSYANLKTAVADHLNRSDLSSYIDDFLDIAEAMHKRDIRVREMIQRDAITIDDRQEALPSGVLEIISLRLLTTPVTVLEHVNLHEMNRWRQEVTGKPSRFTIHEQIEFDVEPDSSYSGEIVYYGAFTALSGSATSNALLVMAPDVYLYGCLVAASPFLGADERIPVWGSLYKAGVEGLNARARAGRVVGPLVSRLAGSVP